MVTWPWTNTDGTGSISAALSTPALWLMIAVWPAHYDRLVGRSIQVGCGTVAGRSPSVGDVRWLVPVWRLHCVIPVSVNGIVDKTWRAASRECSSWCCWSSASYNSRLRRKVSKVNSYDRPYLWSPYVIGRPYIFSCCFMVALCNRADHIYFHPVSFFFFFFFFLA